MLSPNVSIDSSKTLNYRFARRHKVIVSPEMMKAKSKK